MALDAASPFATSTSALQAKLRARVPIPAIRWDRMPTFRRSQQIQHREAA
jgi:hypothetical protein